MFIAELIDIYLVKLFIAVSLVGEMYEMELNVVHFVNA